MFFCVSSKHKTQNILVITAVLCFEIWLLSLNCLLIKISHHSEKSFIKMFIIPLKSNIYYPLTLCPGNIISLLAWARSHEKAMLSQPFLYAPLPSVPPTHCYTLPQHLCWGTATLFYFSSDGKLPSHKSDFMLFMFLTFQYLVNISEKKEQ